ncbi:MAG TPA: 50S ribosomal protein L13 [Clostridiaceae bacterium]|nr:50S ribosomal protein L13 [Clostridiaceae bacterium]
MSTYVAKSDDIQRKWYVVDAADQTLGRLATQIAMVLMGKNKPEYTPSVECGDYVVVVNAAKVNLTGRKLEQKTYNYHTNYPGGLRQINYAAMLQKKPEKVIQLAVKGMLPKNKLGRQMLKKLKVYADAEHMHQAQQPEELEL